jgi:hypothetical protein
MIVAFVYAAILVIADRRLQALGFRRAADIAVMLAVSLSALPAWSILRLTGEWPGMDEFNPPFLAQQYMASRWMVLELTVILAALLVLRTRRTPMLMHPISVALFWLWMHGTQSFELAHYASTYNQWMMLAGSLVILAIAEQVERWQLREGAEKRQGDYAASFWLVGCAAFAVSYMALWLRADEWKHLMPLVAAALVLVALVVRRRTVAALGLVGMFGYLVYLASEVFKDSAAFPVVLAGLGILTIVATVWIQRRFPVLVQRFGAPSGRALPWSPGMAWLPAFFCFGMAIIGLADAAEERAQREFRERLHILRMHSGSYPASPRRPRPAGPADSTQKPLPGQAPARPATPPALNR